VVGCAYGVTVHINPSFRPVAFVMYSQQRCIQYALFPYGAEYLYSYCTRAVAPLCRPLGGCCPRTQVIDSVGDGRTNPLVRTGSHSMTTVRVCMYEHEYEHTYCTRVHTRSNQRPTQHLVSHASLVPREPVTRGIPRLDLPTCCDTAPSGPEMQVPVTVLKVCDF
jgi:hypothetical protein